MVTTPCVECRMQVVFNLSPPRLLVGDVLFQHFFCQVSIHFQDRVYERTEQAVYVHSVEGVRWFTIKLTQQAISCVDVGSGIDS